MKCLTVCRRRQKRKKVVEFRGYPTNPLSQSTMCNPIGQAVFLNKEKMDLNLILGLCVGHDTLFIKYSEAPVTVFATKDRVLGHNPMAALYLSESYYHDKFYKEME